MEERKDVKRDWVFEHLYNAIKKGDFYSGQTLTERELATRLGVSRTPIREAFRLLENLGLVESHPHKGIRVISIPQEQIKYLYQIREVLEGLGVKTLALSKNEEAIIHLRGLIEKAELAMQKEDIALLAKINTEFHLSIAYFSGNIYLKNTMQTLQSHMSLLMSTSLSHRGRPAENIREHRLILQAIENGDSELAEANAKSHVRNAFKIVMTELEMQNNLTLAKIGGS